MIYNGTESNTRPSRVLIESLPGNSYAVRMGDNIEEIEDEEGGIIYRYDEAAFVVDHAVTEAEIEAHWDTWWDYQPPIPPIPKPPMSNEELQAELEVQAQAIEELAAIIGGEE